MHHEVTTHIAATPAATWQILTDIERWPEWTDSINQVERLDEGPLAIGSRAKVRQPRLPAAVWTVTQLTAPTSFTWVSKAPGITTTAGHKLTPSPEGGLVLRLTLTQAGPLAPVLALLTARLTRRYLAMESQGLKHRAES